VLRVARIRGVVNASQFRPAQQAVFTPQGEKECYGAEGLPLPRE